MSELTQILQSMERGDAVAADRLYPVVYNELRSLAAQKFSRESSGHTLQATALVHEAWLRLGGEQQPSWKSRAHFFSAAAKAMRRILIDHARKRIAARRGSGLECVELDQATGISQPQADERLLAISEALDKFAVEEPQKAELVKLRYFVGLTIEETATALDISDATAKRWWSYARAWLLEELGSL